MTDRITKALKKLTPREQKDFKKILLDIQNNRFGEYDVKRLVGKSDIFRIRKGRYRIIFHAKGDQISILTLEKRNDNTYH